MKHRECRLYQDGRPCPDCLMEEAVRAEIVMLTPAPRPPAGKLAHTCQEKPRTSTFCGGCMMETLDKPVRPDTIYMNKEEWDDIVKWTSEEKTP